MYVFVSILNAIALLIPQIIDLEAVAPKACAEELVMLISQYIHTVSQSVSYTYIFLIGLYLFTLCTSIPQPGPNNRYLMYLTIYINLIIIILFEIFFSFLFIFVYFKRNLVQRNIIFPILFYKPNMLMWL